MLIPSPFSKKTLACATTLALFVVAGFSAHRAYFLIDELHEPFWYAIWHGFAGGNVFRVFDHGPYPGMFPVTLILAYCLIPFAVIALSVFPGMMWQYPIAAQIMAGIMLAAFLLAFWLILKKAPTRWRNMLLWILLILWGVYGAFCLNAFLEAMP